MFAQSSAQHTLNQQQFDVIQSTVRARLLQHPPVVEQDLGRYVEALRTVREAEFREWLNGLSSWGAIINLPGLTRCFGGRVFEAMAAGRPVISWKIPDRPKTNALFQDDCEIVLFSDHSPESLAERIEYVLSDPKRAGEMGASGQRKLLTYSDRLTILLSVYSAFSAAVVGGIWSKVPLLTLLILALVCAALLAATLLFTIYGGRAAGLSEGDGRTMLYCGSLKSLVSGVPMARVLFPSAQIGAIILPVMIYHQLQLMVCATIARRQGSKPAG